MVGAFSVEQGRKEWEKYCRDIFALMYLERNKTELFLLISDVISEV